MCMYVRSFVRPLVESYTHLTGFQLPDHNRHLKKIGKYLPHRKYVMLALIRDHWSKPTKGGSKRKNTDYLHLLNLQTASLIIRPYVPSTVFQSWWWIILKFLVLNLNLINGVNSVHAVRIRKH